MTILLFGGSGRLGTAILRLLSSSHTIIAPGRETLTPSDPIGLEQLLNEHKPDLIINTIAYNQVDKAEEQPAEAFLVNAEIPRLLATTSAAKNIPLFHFSTDYVFEGTKPEGYIETDIPAPINIYGTSKRKGEEEVLANHPNAYVIRISRLYGAPATSANAKRSFVEVIIDDTKKSSVVPVLDQEVSSPTYVDDVVKHMEAHLFPFPAPGIYHLANTGGATWNQWAQAIITNLNLPTTITPRDPSTLTRPAKRPQHSMLLNTKLPPLRPWQEALADFLKQESK
ncbi:NAD(P)-dependent oxidoreductase [Patescibacteria group bacterium]|nr:NAD(P)-dependent oxidoreductase [Patescibacteria group bacterium]MBP9710023.1 NAD(P)-dependent oxidoreductase [Patescibacteria group bacterium]